MSCRHKNWASTAALCANLYSVPALFAVILGFRHQLHEWEQCNSKPGWDHFCHWPVKDVHFPFSLSLSDSDKVCASAGNPPSWAQLYIPWDIQRNTSITSTCCNRECVCKARCAISHPENLERENMSSPLLAVLAGESVPCQHDQKRSSHSKNQRSQLPPFWSCCSSQQEITTTPLGSSHPCASTWLPSKEERRNSEQEASSSSASISFMAQAVPLCTAQPLRELTMAFTALCSGPQLHLPGERRIISFKMQ